MTLKKGEKIVLPVTIKPKNVSGNKVKLRLESVLGPIPGFEANLTFIIGSKKLYHSLKYFFTNAAIFRRSEKWLKPKF